LGFFEYDQNHLDDILLSQLKVVDFAIMRTEWRGRNALQKTTLPAL